MHLQDNRGRQGGGGFGGTLMLRVMTCAYSHNRVCHRSAHCTGITRSNLHKRRPTGAKRKIHRKKRKFELGRPAAMTKLTHEGYPLVRPVRVRGGNYKLRALKLSRGNFAWGSEGTARKCRILDVVYNATNQELTRTKTLVKGAIVQIDASNLKSWYEERYNETLGKTKEEKVDLSTLPKEKQEAIKKAREARKEEMDDLLRDQFATGRVLAKITSRPGQTGRADGYILEGPELAFYLRRITVRRGAKKA